MLNLVLHAKQLDKASSILFFLGFATSYLRFAPIVLLAALSNIISLFLYLFAYLFWLAACQLYPNHPALQEKWYGFAQFKDQNRTAAIIGTVALLCSAAALFFPIAVLPACWLFVISNGVWLIAEYHKKQNPLPYEQNYSSKKQETYLHYALVITAASLVTALATTIIFFVPIIALPTIIISSIFAVFFCGLSIQHWVALTFDEYPPDNQKESYKSLLSDKLAPKQPDLSSSNAVEPQSFPSLFSSTPPSEGSSLSSLYNDETYVEIKP